MKTKIIKSLTTKHNITFRIDNKGELFIPVNSEILKELANDYYGKYLWLSTKQGAFNYGVFVERYLNACMVYYPSFFEGIDIEFKYNKVL